MPRISGANSGFRHLVVFLSLVFLGLGLGAVGMLLSVPLTIIVKIMLENSDDFHWVACSAGPDPGPAVKPHNHPPPVKEPKRNEQRAADPPSPASDSMPRTAGDKKTARPCVFDGVVRGGRGGGVPPGGRLDTRRRARSGARRIAFSKARAPAR
jgi:hypothetical protein